MQVPGVCSVRVLPLTVQTAAVVVEKATARPELALALKLALVPATWVPGEVKLSVCEACDSVKLLVTDVAAAKAPLPAWLAVTLQVPAETSVSVLPLTVQTGAVVDANDTDRPELALADRVNVGVVSTWLPGVLKLMVCATGAGAATVKLRVNAAAAAYTVLPAWLAVMLQVPTLTRLSVVPLTVQTAGVVDAKPTVNPELALADKAGGALPSTWLAGAAKVMLWLACDTAKLLLTAAAGAQVPLPAWLATTVQVPALTRLSVVPLTVQTTGVVDAKPTVNPELALADKAGGAMPSTWPPGAVKLMVCVVRGAAATLKLRVTGVAALKLALPAWLAVIEQVPTATRLTVAPLTVQTDGELDAKLTAKPDEAVATSAGTGVPRIWLAGAVKLMVCAYGAGGATAKATVTGVAAEKVALPAWLAVMPQAPKVSSVSVLPLTVQTLGMVEAKPTARPELALADKAGGSEPKVWLLGETKLMV